MRHLFALRIAPRGSATDANGDTGCIAVEKADGRAVLAMGRGGQSAHSLKPSDWSGEQSRFARGRSTLSRIVRAEGPAVRVQPKADGGEQCVTLMFGRHRTHSVARRRCDDNSVSRRA